jgi:hypothetical protein
MGASQEAVIRHLNNKAALNLATGVKRGASHDLGKVDKSSKF